MKQVSARHFGSERTLNSAQSHEHYQSKFPLRKHQQWIHSKLTSGLVWRWIHPLFFIRHARGGLSGSLKKQGILNHSVWNPGSNPLPRLVYSWVLLCDCCMHTCRERESIKRIKMDFSSKRDGFKGRHPKDVLSPGCIYEKLFQLLAHCSGNCLSFLLP